jgi:hypothetical protein
LYLLRLSKHFQFEDISLFCFGKKCEMMKRSLDDKEEKKKFKRTSMMNDFVRFWNLYYFLCLQVFEAEEKKLKFDAEKSWKSSK